MAKKRECKDCLEEGITTGRPAPHPGPRCATHHRERKRATSEGAWAKRVEETYGITSEEYYAILEHQGGVCALCRRANGRSKRLSVDHSHLTGEVRGVICSRCNAILGHMRDDPAVADRFAEYLTNPPARAVLVPEDEEWRTCIESDLHEVSSLGRVRSWCVRGSWVGNRSEEPRMLSILDNGNGYQQVSLGRGKKRYVHDLVAAAFIGEKPDGCHVCHIDYDKSNNRASNLRYDTPSGNSRDVVRSGNHNRAKFTEAEVVAILDRLQSGEPAADLADEFGVGRSTIYNIASGRTWAWIPHPYRGKTHAIRKGDGRAPEKTKPRKRRTRRKK